MYLPSHFQAPSQAAVDQLVAQYPLATLIVANPDQTLPWIADPLPMICEGPVVVSSSLWGHVAKANPLWQHAGPATAVFTGARAYISPNAYPSKQQHHKVVPTYNYAIVQASGRLLAHHEDSVKRRVVARLTDLFERQSQAPWSVDDAPADYLEMMINAIVVVELQIEVIQAKWKVSQNRSVQDQHGVVAALKAQVGTSDATEMATLVLNQIPPQSN